MAIAVVYMIDSASDYPRRVNHVMTSSQSQSCTPPQIAIAALQLVSNVRARYCDEEPCVAVRLRTMGTKRSK